MTAPLAAAVIAQGSFVATGRNKVVQHLEGGIIKELLVEEGDQVELGQPWSVSTKRRRWQTNGNCSCARPGLKPCRPADGGSGQDEKIEYPEALPKAAATPKSRRSSRARSTTSGVRKQAEERNSPARAEHRGPEVPQKDWQSSNPSSSNRVCSEEEYGEEKVAVKGADPRDRSGRHQARDRGRRGADRPAVGRSGGNKGSDRKAWPAGSTAAQCLRQDALDELQTIEAELDNVRESLATRRTSSAASPSMRPPPARDQDLLQRRAASSKAARASLKSCPTGCP